MSQLGRVLVVEDDALVRMVLVPVLEELAEKVVDVSSGQVALGLLGNEPFDLVVSDFRMPGLNGLEVLAAVHERHPATRLLLISGYAGEEIVSQVAELGGRVLHKPFGAEELRNVVLKK